MPFILAPAVPALVAAAEYTLTALAGIVIGVGVGVGIDEATKDKEEDKAKTETGTIASSRTKCEKCPAIDKVMMDWEKTNGRSDLATSYQAFIANTIFNPVTKMIEVWVCFNVSFDGWKPAQCLFLEAKAQYDNFFEDGEPKWFFKSFRKKPTDKTGLESMLSQATRQNTVCTTLNNIPKSHWHFLQPVSYGYFLTAFSIYPNIKVFHTLYP
ncbi:restriction endonuclease fold toxin 5 domain-containing protein [Xenorhabdus bovienii]|uniref:Restriction endonuclease fold toxin 5 domain-containing protein n=1 Tax=Xenorhabdus bovienii TaxID=40576 RepID=A0AAJ1J8S9_XENBV|nr:restriction endonuclease fold toxin 5 domain-containing protein [Xenorhabdus bovienii]MDE1478321.1 restriction endonuclease fold toxin 5 domain-containing protein [Xenorhabdus bovienii]MDE9495780.1 restriction endonuclease fold toxin 5 domain-containing protein [Xenorhabdus bovienii]MDE9504182.1 restriction endonuclease fold toxin 5 domain-containing protein [Xenorhabdus bovienii]MDE9510177.1 restriction endonuclease fold toxin 5 domain-containing protein [Xenorhabdus bovienii]MDE9521818.1 